MQKGTQKGTIDLKAAVILDQTQFFEFIHEDIDSGARRPDRFREGLLRDPGESFLSQAFFLGTGEVEKGSGQALLGGIKKLIDEVGFDSDVPGKQVRNKTIAEYALGVEEAKHFFFFDHEHRGRNYCGSCANSNWLLPRDSLLRKSRQGPASRRPLLCQLR